MASDIVGSWFPTGYYGHFRSKSRNDFVCEHRQLAKPQPPEKFFRRSKQPVSRHVFSHHDNRQAFLTDALYFEQGNGRKRVPNKTYNFKPEFISWIPEREYLKRMRPLLSTYTTDYMKQGHPQQLIVRRPQTSFDDIPTTTYRYVHGKDSPNRDLINAMNNEALNLTATFRSQRSKSARPVIRETVASCLNWHVPQPPCKPKVPTATECTDTQVLEQMCQESSAPAETSQQVALPVSSPPEPAETE